jgi:hypothetical protein
MSRLFGWSYPPGVSKLPWDDVPDPSPESEEVCRIFEDLIITLEPKPNRAQDQICEIVERLTQERDRLKELLQATLCYLPERGEPPACTCKPGPKNAFSDADDWCERHDGDWDEPSLKEEIGVYLKPSEEGTK